MRAGLVIEAWVHVTLKQEKKEKTEIFVLERLTETPTSIAIDTILNYCFN